MIKEEIGRGEMQEGRDKEEMQREEETRMGVLEEYRNRKRRK